MCLIRQCRVTNCDFHWNPRHWLGLPHRGHWVSIVPPDSVGTYLGNSWYYPSSVQPTQSMIR